MPRSKAQEPDTVAEAMGRSVSASTMIPSKGPSRSPGCKVSGRMLNGAFSTSGPHAVTSNAQKAVAVAQAHPRMRLALQSDAGDVRRAKLTLPEITGKFGDTVNGRATAPGTTVMLPPDF